ncbi:MAG: phosphoribosylglycinamide formyltransferase [Bacteroidota bacterium]
MKKIALFASGSGTNVENIINYFKDNQQIHIELVMTNNPDAYVIKRAEKSGTDCMIFNKNDFYNTDNVLNTLINRKIDFIILAGFLWLVPSALINYYPKKIVNIHPALLPKFGGKGMYGMKVHESVIANKEKESGITVHLVNEKYDDGSVIFQKRCEITSVDNAESLANKIHKIEYEYYPQIIEKIVTNKI